MSIDTDFRTLTVEGVAEFFVAHVAELGDPTTIETLAVDDIVSEVKAGLAVVVAERKAVAIVLSEVDHIRKCNPVLWLLYVAPASRGQGLGAAFVAEIRRRFEKELPMAVLCNGPEREGFFAACGFHLYERHDDGRLTMIADSRAAA